MLFLSDNRMIMYMRHEVKTPHSWAKRYSGVGKDSCMLKIEQILKERGLSQAKAARLADVNETSMSRIVRGIEPPFPKRGQRIADAIGWDGIWTELFEEVEAD